MATKTITVEIEAYNKLVAARRTAKESFSQVIYRASWPKSGATGDAILRHIDQLAADGKLLDDDSLAALDDLQQQDPPPEDRWRS